jgi:GTP:adenosylcobinamide-phosphate guanylyltransferase
LTERRWNVLVLAAGRGPDDPMAKAYGVTNKCLIPVAGLPMLARAIAALEDSGAVTRPVVVTEAMAATAALLGERARLVAPARSAPASVLAALARGDCELPLLVTTGDHALLTAGMVGHFLTEAEASGADFCVGLATAETILAAYPDTRRTFFRLGPDRVSGCNLFAIRDPRGLAILERWQYLEQLRKKPWRLVAVLGIAPLLAFLTGRLTLAKVFAMASARLGMTAAPVFMPFAEAAIDVDKPADKDLAERILAARQTTRH